MCVVCAQNGTVFVNKPKRDRGGEGSNRRRRERANYCKVCVSGEGLEGDLLSRQRQHSTGTNLSSIFLFCLTFPPPPSFITREHLIRLSLDLEATFVLLLCFSLVSPSRCSGQPCLPDVGSSSQGLSWRWPCEHALRQSSGAGCRADLKWHSLDGFHFSLFSLLYILVPISWAICCVSPYHRRRGLHCLSSCSGIWATIIIQTCCIRRLP